MSDFPDLYNAYAKAIAAVPLTDKALIAVACSGGADSLALLRIAGRFAAEHGKVAYAFHINHAIAAQSDDWQQRAHQQALAAGLRFVALKVEVSAVTRAQEGLEAAARQARYQALDRLCALHGVQALCLAHHLDDQCETLLLRLLRGAGPLGLSAMPAQQTLSALLTAAESPTTWLLRPWLGFRRAQLRVSLDHTAAAAVDDPSNRDVALARGFLRTQLLPTLELNWPGYRHTLARLAVLMGDTEQILEEVAQADLSSVCAPLEPNRSAYPPLRLAALEALSVPRQRLLLRAWLRLALPLPPSSAVIEQMLHQLLQARQLSDPLIRCAGESALGIRRYRGCAYLALNEIALPDKDFLPDSLPQWLRPESENDERRFDVLPASWELAWAEGSFEFTQGCGGLDPVWFRNQTFTVGPRQGGEKLKLHPRQPSRNLKHWYQRNGIASWQRSRLPLLSLSTDPGLPTSEKRLVHAAGLGTDSRLPHAAPDDPAGVKIIWRPRNGLPLL